MLALWCAGLAGVGAGWSAEAQEPPTVPATSDAQWSFSGFGTLGVVRQTGGASWGFLRDNNQVGATSHLSATPDSRIGGQVNWSDGGNWEAALQAVIMDVPSNTPAEESIKWAYAGYRPTSTTRVRLGRTSPDLYLFADTRHVGFAYPWVRPPVNFYGVVPVESINGADLEQRWSLGDAAWSARASAGSSRSTASGAQGMGTSLHNKNLVALSLTREDGGLLMKVSYLRGRVALSIPQVSQLKEALAAVGTLPVPGLASTIGTLQENLWLGGPVNYLGLAAQYETGAWTFIAEGSKTWIPASQLNARRAYVSAGWRHGLITYYGVASGVLPGRAATPAPEIATSLTPIIGAEQALRAQTLAGIAAAAGDNFRADARSVGAGLRWDCATSIALKLQIDRFDVHSHGGAGWRNYDGSAANGTLMSVAIDVSVGS